MKGHALNMCLAVIFSVLIWMAIGSHLIEQDKVTIDFRVEVPDDVIISFKGQPSAGAALVLNQAVKVTLRGPKEQIDRLSQLVKPGLLAISSAELEEAFKRDPPSLLVDPRKGILVSDTLEVVETEPTVLRLEFERVRDHLVWVESGEVEGEPAPGFRLGQVTVSPRRVAVRGPASMLKNSYKTLAVPLGGANGTFEVERPLDCPAAVIAPRVRVTVEILPDFVEKELEFRVEIMRSANSPDAPLTPLPYTITAREGWTRKIKLRGPKQALQDLEDELDRARLERGIGSILPLAHVPRRELPDRLGSEEHDRNDNLRIVVSGLPPGVEIVEPPLLPVNMARVDK